MSWSLHHVNLNACDVAASVAFFRDIIGLEGGRSRAELLGNPTGANTEAYFFGDGLGGLHIGKPDLGYALRHKLPINPTLGGHVAVTVQDLAAVKRRLDAAGIVYSDPGAWGALPGIAQIYVCDPSYNIIEINQITRT